MWPFVGQFAANIEDLSDVPAVQETRRLDSEDMEEYVKIHAKAFRSPKNALDMAVHMFAGLLETGQAEAYAVDSGAKSVAIGLLFC